MIRNKLVGQLGGITLSDTGGTTTKPNVYIIIL